MHKVLLADTDALLKKAFALRREVFVVEQNVDTNEEFDEFETQSRHFVILDEKERPLGAARWRKTDKGIKLERFAVKKSARGKGIGASLVKTVLDDIKRHQQEGAYLYLHAQLPAGSLYERFGFKKKGDQFEECGILHHLMYRQL